MTDQTTDDKRAESDPNAPSSGKMKAKIQSAGPAPMSPAHRRSAVFRYALALISVALALGVGLLGWQYGIRRGQVTVLAFAIAVAAWYGGAGPAALAITCSCLGCAYFFMEPLHSFGVNRDELPVFLLLVLFGTLIGWFGTVRRRAEEELTERARLLDLTHDTVFVRDMNDVITYWNRGAEELYGWKSDEAIGQVTHELMRTIFPEPLDQINAELLRTGRWEGELIHTTRESTRVTVASRWSLQRDKSGEPSAILETNNNVSERKQAEDDLRKQAELLSLANDAIIVRDPESRVTFWNPGAEKTYGWTAPEAIGKVTHELLQTRFPVSREAVDVALEKNGEWEGEVSHITRKGAAIVVASRQSLRRDKRGIPAAILEINRDITDRKQAEEAIRKMNEELEQRVIERTRELEAVNKELEAFAYSVSHDLRAPVRHIAGFTELLQKHAEAVLDDKSRRHITMILESANRMGSLVDDLLAFSRIGRAEAQNTDVDLAQTVKNVLAELAPDTQARKIIWRVGDLPKAYGDPAMLRLVFTNLVSNALKFTRTREQAEIQIGSLNHRSDEVALFVKDNGVGFDMKYENKLFGVFQRLHSQEIFEGTGIGLATVERVVRRHGGRVWAEGSVDHGATFFFALPKPER